MKIFIDKVENPFPQSWDAKRKCESTRIRVDNLHKATTGCGPAAWLDMLRSLDIIKGARTRLLTHMLMWKLVWRSVQSDEQRNSERWMMVNECSENIFPKSTSLPKFLQLCWSIYGQKKYSKKQQTSVQLPCWDLLERYVYPMCNVRRSETKTPRKLVSLLVRWSWNSWVQIK